jgi:signal recognition particle subunit SRP54
MAGLQGSGKTTTSGKLAAWLKKGGHRPMLVSVDVYRPAAREQLKHRRQVHRSQALRGQARRARSTARRWSSAWPRKPAARPHLGCDILIVDTAGRNQIDASLMDEMERSRSSSTPPKSSSSPTP